MKIYKNMLHYSCLRIESTDSEYTIDMIQNAIITNIDNTLLGLADKVN